MKKYLKITIHPLDREQKEILIALLPDIGFYAFEEGEDALHAFVEEENFNEQQFLASLPEKTESGIIRIEEKNWNQQWESAFQPVIVRDFAGIRAGFHQALDNVRYEIIITPRMSFGTGHHATTYMMIDMMSRLDFNRKSVIDFGTGTGILAILAEKMGAESVVAIDHDEWSINNSGENIDVNHCQKVLIFRDDDLENYTNADIVLANINLNVLVSHARMLDRRLNSKGYLLLSGFLKDDVKQITTVFGRTGLSLVDESEMGMWTALVFRKP